ncbi:Fc.00g037240.m01.CDS01 [Cosmosporella sp. VM-42]
MARKILISDLDADIQLPKGLDFMYDRMLLGLESDGTSDVIRWVTMALRPLTIAELRIVTGFEKQVDKRVHECRHIIRLTGNNGYENRELQLIYLSLRDHLLRIPTTSRLTSWNVRSQPRDLRLLEWIRNQNFSSKLVDHLLLMSILVLIWHLFCRYTAPMLLFIASTCALIWSLKSTAFVLPLLEKLESSMKLSTFAIQHESGHKYLSARCFELMEHYLKLANFDFDYPSGNQSTGLQKGKLASRIPPGAQYACRYWVGHLGNSKFRLRNHDRTHTFLQDSFLIGL